MSATTYIEFLKNESLRLSKALRDLETYQAENDRLSAQLADLIDSATSYPDGSKTIPGDWIALDPADEIDSGFIKILTAIKTSLCADDLPVIDNKAELITELENLTAAPFISGKTRANFEQLRQILQALPEAA